jgi:hypothetical protein
MEVRHATLEDVQKNQENLIHGTTGLDILIENNGIITPHERNIYFKWIAFSLLGKGLKYIVILHFNGGNYKLGSVSTFSRKMAYYTNKNVELILNGRRTTVPIGKLWEALRNALYEPMDEALDAAVHLSKERDIIRPGKGASMDNVKL